MICGRRRLRRDEVLVQVDCARDCGSGSARSARCMARVSSGNLAFNDGSDDQNQRL